MLLGFVVEVTRVNTETSRGTASDTRRTPPRHPNLRHPLANRGIYANTVVTTILELRHPIVSSKK